MQELKVFYPDGSTTIWDPVAKALYLGVTPGTTPPGPTGPTGPTGPAIPTVPGILVNVAWPPSGQVRTTIGNPDGNVYKLRTQIPTNIVPKPNNLGFCRFTEVPGADYEATHVKVYVNGLLKFDTGQSGDTSPGVDWCMGRPTNYKQIGGKFNVQPGDLLEVTFQCYNWAAGQNASRLYDFATPLRY